MKAVKAWAVVSDNSINDLDGQCLQIFFNEDNAKNAAAEESYGSQRFEAVRVEIREVKPRRKK